MRRSLVSAAIACVSLVSACGYGSAPPRVNKGVAAAAAGSLGAKVATVAAAGDIACATPVSAPGCRAADTAKLVERLRPDLVLALGDLSYEDGSATEFAGGYAPTWGRFRSITFPVPGNHEYNTADAAGYKGWWGREAMPDGTTWHSRRVGSWLLLGLDSDCGDVGGCGPDSAQGRWLSAQLRGAPKCVIAIWHHPRRSSGPHGDNSAVQPLWQMLANARADMVLNGHDHDYERFAPLDSQARPAKKGMREFVVGTGGKQPYPLVRSRPGSEASVQGMPGVLELELHTLGWSWRFVTTAGRVEDSGSSACA